VLRKYSADNGGRVKIKNLMVALVFYLYNDFITHFPSYIVRHLYLRNVLKIQLGKGSSIHMGCFFSGRHVSIGKNSVINRNCYIDGREGVAIGENVSISPEAYILSLDHDPDSPNFETIPKPTVIKDFVWIGVRALILPGIHLPYGCVVGAGAVVTKNPEPYDIVAGVPARKIGVRTKELNYTLKYFPYFNTDVVSNRKVFKSPEEKK
jgi:acetyltransferase-like isoleucine patch superfamily enzyme